MIQTEMHANIDVSHLRIYLMIYCHVS